MLCQKRRLELLDLRSAHLLLQVPSRHSSVSLFPYPYETKRHGHHCVDHLEVDIDIRPSFEPMTPRVTGTEVQSNGLAHNMCIALMARSRF